MDQRLDVSVVLRKVWRIYIDQAPVLMPAAAVVFVFTGILSAVLLREGEALELLAGLVSLVAISLFTGMVVELVGDVEDGRRDATPARLLRSVLPMLGSVILIGIVAGLLISITLVLVIVPLILLTIWSVAIPVVVVERPPGLRALRRSRELVRGNGWQVFGVILILYFLVLVVSAALEAAASSASAAAGLVVAVVVGVLTAPLPALAQAVLYFELIRVRGERRSPGGEPVERSAAPSPDPFGGA